ncbi:hypothetical protein [Methylobacterium sp. A54F]
MAEITNELLYEVLKAVQAPLGNMDESMREMRGEIGGVRTSLQAVQTDIGNLYESYGALDARLSRIERRLDIISVPAN